MFFGRIWPRDLSVLRVSVGPNSQPQLSDSSLCYPLLTSAKAAAGCTAQPALQPTAVLLGLSAYKSIFLISLVRSPPHATVPGPHECLQEHFGSCALVAGGGACPCLLFLRPAGRARLFVLRLIWCGLHSPN